MKYAETFDQGPGGWYGWISNAAGPKPLEIRDGCAISRRPWWIDYNHVFLSLLFLGVAGRAGAQTPAEQTMTVHLDPITRYFHISYPVPAGAPDPITVLCMWTPHGQDRWQTAVVTPLMDETTARLVSEDAWRQWVMTGTVIERRAAGLRRTVVFNPYPEAQTGGKVDADFRVQLKSADGGDLSVCQSRLEADNSDVVCVEDWSKVLQEDALAVDPKPEDRQWRFRTDLDPNDYSLGNALFGASPPDVPLPQLTYPLDLRGHYALFIRSLAHGHALHLRLSGDERCDQVCSYHPRWETFWRWCRLDRQHLVLRQSHYYNGYVPAHIDYVRLVPLTPALVEQLERPFAGARDRVVAGYFEPYSWAFNARIEMTAQHREPLLAFAQARVNLVDIQIGRFGDKAVYESRLTDPLLYGTFGDPIGKTTPRTTNVGRMQQFTNTLDAELRYARELGLTAHANFGATSCYPGTPAESEFSKAHPEWRNGNCLKYSVPEVREYVLGLYREALDIGAPGISIDYCRYPDGLDSPETVTAFHRELRKLTNEFAAARAQPVPILVRFPAQGVRQWRMFDYVTWAREGLVDFLCPSNLQGRHHHFDIAPYVQAVSGNPCKLLPVVDGLQWGPAFPGPFLWRVQQLYDAGVAGVYVYQADARVLARPSDRRTMAVLGSSAAVRDWWEQDRRERPQRSKCITITAPHHLNVYNQYERLRIWTDGLPLGTLEVYLDDKPVGTFSRPPYLLGTEEMDSDPVIPAGEHQLRVRARDDDGWLEQTFTIAGAR